MLEYNVISHVPNPLKTEVYIYMWIQKNGYTTIQTKLFEFRKMSQLQIKIKLKSAFNVLHLISYVTQTYDLDKDMFKHTINQTYSYQ